MVFKAPVVLAILIVGLVVGGGVGYFARTSEVSALQSSVTKVIEGKGMLEAELRGKTVPITFVPEPGQMIHDAWLLIGPAGQGKFAVVVRAEGLDKTGPEDVYLVEGVTRTEPMRTVPIGPSVEASEFHADVKGQGLYWVVLEMDPRTTFDKILILYLPGMSMERAVLLATAKLG